MSRYRYVLAGAVAALLLAALLTVPAAKAQSQFTLTASAQVVDAGQSVDFVGTGFQDERVSYWATAPDGSVLGSADNAAFGGEVRFSFQVPGDGLGGRWAMTAYGDQTKTPVITTFNVNGRDPSTAVPPATVWPANPVPGDTMSFGANGYKKQEHVSWWVTGPDNVVHDAGPEGTKANNSGEISFRWRLPEGSMPGTWVMTMQGVDSGVARAVSFQVQ
jgi:hypothetical protein